MAEIDEALGQFAADDYTVRLVSSFCAVVPFAPSVQHFSSLAEGLKQQEPRAKRQVLERAQEIARSPDAQRALWLASAMDTADSGISAFSGVKSAVELFRSQEGQRLNALDTDAAQATDAVLKAIALASVISRLYSGGPLEKVDAFRASNTGQALALYFAAIEVGLPFADNAVSGGAGVLGGLYSRFGEAQRARFAASSGEAASDGVLDKLLGPIDALVHTSAPHLKGIADAAGKVIPGAMNMGDKAAGIVATGADIFPVYRYLGARLVAERCISLALAEMPVKEESEIANPAMHQIQYTTKKPDRDDIVVPAAKKRGCLPFVVLWFSGLIPAVYAIREWIG